MTSEGSTAPARKRPSRWHRPLWWLNVLAVVVLLVTYLAPSTSPETAWPLVLLAFSFPYQLLVHAAFLVYWAVFRRKRMLLSSIALLIGWGHTSDHVQLMGSSSAPKELKGEAVKLLSWNVRLFDLYDWKKSKRTHEAIFKVLHRENADILCLQEFFHSPDKRFFRTRDALVKEFPYKYEHTAWSHKARFDQHFGIATFSAHPIVGRGTVKFSRRSGNICIWSDIALSTDTVRVYNAHLASYHFGGADYRFIDSLDTDVDADELKESGGRILGLLRVGAIRRADEVGAIVRHMEQSPHPVLFCGDLNDVAMSYAYAQLRESRCDAFVESGSGLGGTYIGKLPKLRIDHILHDPAIATWDFHTLPEELSDHHALTVRMAVR
jgi:endonuclease/exonuclease/phosphatase family metal-dependent hydrolase